MHRNGRPPGLRVEIAGWLAFILFVACVWMLREKLDRPYRES